MKAKLSIEDALIDANENSNIDSIFFVGGAQVYEQVINDKNYNLNTAYVISVNEDYKCDKFIDTSELETRVTKNKAYEKNILYSDNDFTATEYRNLLC